MYIIKHISTLFILITMYSIAYTQDSYNTDNLLRKQLNTERVQNAKQETDKVLQKLFKDSGLAYPPHYIFWRGLKKEGIMELWATDSLSVSFKKLKSYKICAASGFLGPKRHQGDKQVPEGLYTIDAFNNYSNFYLSFLVSYPNKSDSILGYEEYGGDIFVHGNCMSIGCLSMGDSLIKEMYWISLQSQNYIGSNAKIPIHIFPGHLNKSNWRFFYQTYYSDPVSLKFWNYLQEAYNYFEIMHKLPETYIDENGRYRVIYKNKIKNTKTN